MILRICRICFVAVLVGLLYRQHCRIEDLEFQKNQIWYSVSHLQLNANEQWHDIKEEKSATHIQLQQLQGAVGDLQQRVGKLEVVGE